MANNYISATRYAGLSSNSMQGCLAERVGFIGSCFLSRADSMDEYITAPFQPHPQTTANPSDPFEEAEAKTKVL